MFWKDIDFEGKSVLDAGTGFGITTTEIAKRVRKATNSIIISIDINPEAFSNAQKSLKMQNSLMRRSLSRIVAFIRADLSHLPIKEGAIDAVVSTRTLADIESVPCHVIRAITEFYRVLKSESIVVISDECPIFSPTSDEEMVAVVRWQLVKAISHSIGRPHANEIFPEDLEFLIELVGFRQCEWRVFRGEKIPRHRINYFLARSTEMCDKIVNPQLKQAFVGAIREVERLYQEKGGVFPSKYILHE